MVTWMAYAAAVAGLLACGALALERLCEKAGWPRRFAWLAALTLALLVPFTAKPPEPRHSGQTPAPIVTAAEVATAASEVIPLRSRDGETSFGETGPGGTDSGGASLAALSLWGIASLGALTIICAVLIAGALARGRWDRRRVAGEDVYVSHDFGPALVGVARPAIVIPGWVLKLGAVVRATVVRHEREHARAWDHLALLYAGLVVAALPWNPAVWWMFLRLRTAVEIDCDRRVLASGIPASEYGDLLLDIGSGRPARPFFALTLAGSESMLERRLKAMRIGTRKVHKFTLALLGCTALAAVVAACEMRTPTAIAPAVNEALAPLDEAGQAAAAEADGAASHPSNPAAPPRAPVNLVAVDEKRVGEVPQAVMDADGGLLIHGISTRLSLTSDLVARDPLVLVDGELVEGGLKALMAGAPLDIVGVGYSQDPRHFPELGDQVSQGVVTLRTKSSETGSVAGGPAAESWQRMGEELRRMDEKWVAFRRDALAFEQDAAAHPRWTASLT